VRWLLDTNVVSEAVKPKADRNVVSWIANQAPEDLAISVLTLAEIREGIDSSESEAKRRSLGKWLDATADLFRERTLSLDQAILVDWLNLSRRMVRQRMTRQAPDLLLASTARVHNLSVATRNTRDFANTGITVYNPWTNETHHMEAP
jgi:predicted nucleic acid-binding protein